MAPSFNHIYTVSEDALIRWENKENNEKNTKIEEENMHNRYKRTRKTDTHEKEYAKPKQIHTK